MNMPIDNNRLECTIKHSNVSFTQKEKCIKKEESKPKCQEIRKNIAIGSILKLEEFEAKWKNIYEKLWKYNCKIKILFVTKRI